MLRRNGGFTLVEILLVMVVGGALMGAIYQMLHVQHRMKRHSDSVIDWQYSMRTALELLATELREASSADADVIDTGPGHIAFRAFRKLGFVCDASVSGQRADVWELGEPFASNPSDSILIFDHGTSRWRGLRVADTRSADASCVGGWDDAPARRLIVPTGDAGRLETVERGAPVREFTHIHYSHEFIDGVWVLARRTQMDDEPVPMLGPLAPPGRNGLRFRYFDEVGVELEPSLPSTTTDVRRVEVQVKGFAPGSTTADLDSLSMDVYLRGNAP